MDGVWMNKRRRIAGTSLIEVLTVIVVFLVGILAVIQIFPNGLRIVRDTKNNLSASALAAAEGQRVASRGASLPEMIVPVVFGGPSGYTALNVQRDPEDLTTPLDGGVGKISASGESMVGGVGVGNWARTSGANVFSRVIGEGGAVPAPRQVGSQFGGLIQLIFGPINYDVDTTTLLGKAGQVTVYGNNLTAKDGDQSNQADLQPVPNDPAATDSIFYYVPSAKSQYSAAFAGEDQLWIGAPIDTGSGLPYASSYRIRYSYYMDNGGSPRAYDGIFIAQPSNTGAYALPAGSNFSIVSVKQLVATSGIFGGGSGSPADFRGVVAGSIQVQRLFAEIAASDGWNPGNPYQYKVLSMGLGAIMVSQYGAGVKVQDAAGETSPLVARVDYSVYDWRIIRDEFRVPASSGSSAKLVLNSLKPLSGSNADGMVSHGLGNYFIGDYSLWTPDAAGVGGSQDFVLVDLETGGVVQGNSQSNLNSAYYVDKSRGVIVFRSVAAGPGIQAYVAYPTGTRTLTGGQLDPAALWSATGTIDISGHPVRALYRANGEFATQVLKAAKNYQVSYPATASALGAGECFAGGSNQGTPWGSGNRLYFPLADFGQKVVVGEAYTSVGVIRDQDLQIDGHETPPGQPTVAFATLPSSGVFDYGQKGYAVRWVRGATMKIRVLWNPDSFALGADQTQNFENFMAWSKSWRKVNTETVEIGGQLK